MIDLFFKNRRLLMLAIVMIIVTGLSSIHVLPRLEDPILQQRAALVHTSFPGANAVRVETLVTEVLEEAVKEIEEIRIIRSGSRNELSTITIELHDYVDHAEPIWSRVRDKLGDSAALLPEGAAAPQFIDLKFSAYAALFSMTWTGETPVNHAVLGRYAEVLEQQLRAIPGTDDVDLFGLATEEIVVEVDQREMTQLGLTGGDVSAAISASDAKVSAGGLRGQLSDIVVEVASEFDSVQRIERTPVKTNPDGTVVTIGNIATVSKSISEPPGTITLIDGNRSVVLASFIQPRVRIDKWSKNAVELIEEFKQQLPQNIKLETIFLQDRYVTQRLAKLLTNLGLGATAVTFVILLMMGWRSALVIGASLPLAGLMVLGGLRFLGIPLHQMSITGLILALGLLIDNAIVAVDEMRNHLKEGKSPVDAIHATVRHLAIPLLGSTFTTCLAFAPLALMPGPAGEFVGSIGISVILAVTSSLFLSLTIIPAIVGILQKNFRNQSEKNFLEYGFGNSLMYRVYRTSLDKLFAVPALGILIGIVLPIFGFVVARQLPEQFFPASDRDQFLVTLQMPPQSSVHETASTALAARDLALEFPEIERMQWFVGESAPAFYYNMLPIRSEVASYAQAMVQTAPGVDVTDTVQRLQVALQDRLLHSQIMVKQLEQGPPVDAPIMIRIHGQNLTQLKQIGDRLRLILSEIPDVITTVSDAGSSTAKMSLQVDETKARLAGLTHQNIAGQLRTALDGQVSGSLLESTEVLPVRIRINGAQRENRDELNSFDLVAGNAAGSTDRVPVNAIAEWKRVPGDSTIERIGGSRMNEIQVHVRAGVLASKVLTEFQTRLKNENIELPPGYSIEFAGESAERDRAVGNLLSSAGILFVLMVAGLVLSFQSFRMATLIGIIGALSVGLGLLSLWSFGFPFGFMAIVGIMGLVGVAINDSIVVLAAIRSDPLAKTGDKKAVSAVVFRATRHVLSTTLTTIAGFMPLILAGGGFWPPLAIAIAGGVSGATILALYFAPSAYILFYRRKRLLAQAA